MSEPRSVAGDRRPPADGDRRPRTKIIDAAVELLGSVPIAKLSVMRIAEHAGVTRPAFYFYFESKYAVVAAALDDVWDELDRATAELTEFRDNEPPADFSARIIAGALEVWQRHASLLNACLQARESDDQLNEMWKRFIGNLTDKLSGFIDELRKSGKRPAIDDTAALTHALVGMTIWAMQEEQTFAASISHERVMTAVRAIWLSAAWGESGGR